MTFKELLEEDILNETSKAQRKAAKRRKQEVHSKNVLQDRPGRERLITNILHACQRRRVPASEASVRNYVETKWKQWSNKDPEAKGILYLEKKAKSLGFNPRKYKNQKPMQSSGKGGPGQPEYSGRAFFFVSFVNMAVAHFEKLSKASNGDK